jgi:caffeoyl-CoA O-methyltransferase
VPRLRPGGIILVDNTFWHGRMVIESVTDAPVQGIRDLNDHAVADTGSSWVMLPIGDGVTWPARINP